jgi:hypothetical protein
MKKLNYIIAFLITIFGVSFEVKALTDTECITSAGSKTCTLSGDVTVSEPLLVQGNIQLDLNGHMLTVTNDAVIKGGFIEVLRGATLTVKDTVGTGKITTGSNSTVYGAIQLTDISDGATGKNATLVVENGTIEGYYYGIVGNGSRHNTNIVINDGNILGLCVDDSTGIYHPQYGTLTINGGTVRGTTGIELRAGVLKVNGGVIEGSGHPTSVTPNGNGSTTVGAGIAIAQHTTLKDIDVKITNGTIKGFSAVYESNPQHNANVAEQVNVSIVGGNFEAINDGEVVVYSEDLTNFISRGTFNKEVSSNYVSDEIEVKQSNGNYVIGSDNYNGLTDDSNYGIDTSYDSANYEAPYESYDIDLSWDDLHWVFVFEGEITNPTREVWVTKEYYDEIGNTEQLSSNELNGEILDSINDLENSTVRIIVENNSAFEVDVYGSIEQKSNENYTNAAGLKIAVDEAENITFENQAEALNLSKGNNMNLLVKPTATRYVNDSGVTTTVTGEIKLTFSKSN